MSIIETIRGLYMNAHQQNVNFRPADIPKKIFEANPARRFLRLHNKSATGEIFIWFGRRPALIADFSGNAGLVLFGEDDIPLNVFQDSGEGVWKGEVWALVDNSGVGNVLNAMEYGNEPLVFQGNDRR